MSDTLILQRIASALDEIKESLAEIAKNTKKETKKETATLPSPKPFFQAVPCGMPWWPEMGTLVWGPLTDSQKAHNAAIEAAKAVQPMSKDSYGNDIYPSAHFASQAAEDRHNACIAAGKAAYIAQCDVGYTCPCRTNDRAGPTGSGEVGGEYRHSVIYGKTPLYVPTGYTGPGGCSHG